MNAATDPIAAPATPSSGTLSGPSDSPNTKSALATTFTPLLTTPTASGVLVLPEEYKTIDAAVATNIGGKPNSAIET